jgi:hypothetical protein
VKRLESTAIAAIVLAPAAAAPAAGPAPTDVATGAAEPSQTSARVLGYFNYGATYPPGIPEQCWFEYGTTLAYGARTNAICAGTTRATLEPLVAGTTYHYRAAASNSAGTTYGPDKTFTTLGSPPAGEPPPPGSPGQTTLHTSSGQSLSALARRGLRLRLALAGPCPCEARATLLVPRRAAKRLHLRRRGLAQARRTFRSNGSASLTLRPPASVRRKLRRARSLKATVQVTVTAAAGEPTKLTRALRLRRR